MGLNSARNEGSTVQGTKSGFLEGHAVIASFGTISVSIHDDLAADTLRMVSEVASYVRRARGVQWGETLKLPTFLKVSAEPQVNVTSIQGLRHVIFTDAGLKAFQNTASVNHETSKQYLGKPISATAPVAVDFEAQGQAQSSGPTPFLRSFTARERTKGVRMDLSLLPMSIILASGHGML